MWCLILLSAVAAVVHLLRPEGRLASSCRHTIHFEVVLILMAPQKNAQTQTALNLFDESCHWFWTRFKLEEVHCRDQSPNLIASCIFLIVPQRCSNLKNQSCHSPILFHANIFKESTSLTVMKPSKDLSRQWGLSVTTFHYILNSKR